MSKKINPFKKNAATGNLFFSFFGNEKICGNEKKN
jgi:hypothetical protein